MAKSPTKATKSTTPPKARARRGRPRTPPAVAPEAILASLSARCLEHFDPNFLNTCIADLHDGALTAPNEVRKLFELGALYDLNPLTGEIWLALGRGLNATAGDWEVFVGRDGYLKVARRFPEFKACIGQPVYAEDELEVSVGPDGSYVVDHRPAHPSKRGEIIGAYARLFRQDIPTAYFFAPAEQYREEGPAWKYLDALMTKCAVSYLTRTTYGVSGPTPYDEVTVGFQPERSVAAALSEPSATRLPDAIERLWQRVKALPESPFSLSELQAQTNGATPAQLRQVEHEMEGWLREHAPPPEPVEQEPEAAAAK